MVMILKYENSFVDDDVPNSTSTHDCFAFPTHMVIQGFYAVYGDVFRRIASEEAQYREPGGSLDDEQLPEFGMPLNFSCNVRPLKFTPLSCTQDYPLVTMKR